MAGQDDDVVYAAEQAARLARIRANIREGVWALRDNSARPTDRDALERGALAGRIEPEAGEPSTATDRREVQLTA